MTGLVEQAIPIDLSVVRRKSRQSRVLDPCRQICRREP
jgi:hypothetical protein